MEAKKAAKTLLCLSAYAALASLALAAAYDLIPLGFAAVSSWVVAFAGVAGATSVGVLIAAGFAYANALVGNDDY